MRRTNPILFCLLVALLFAEAGCANRVGSAAPARSNPTKSQAKGQHVALADLVVTQYSADSIAEIHERGLQSLQNGQWSEAAQSFALCVRAAPDGPLAASANYHWGLALDELGQTQQALSRFLAAADVQAPGPLGTAAALRAVRTACHLEQWSIAAREASRLLERKPALRPIDTILLQGALALERVADADDTAAETHVALARTVIEDQGLNAPGNIPRDIAAVYFALGELRRLRATRITLAPLSDQFSKLLEQRCELILSAQSAYSDAMRAFDAHWSTMAGYRIGELYSDLHQELMKITPPESVTSAHRRDLFEGAMRLRYSILVQKSLNMMKHTLTMAERNGEHSEWVERAKASSSDLEKRLRDEQAAIDRLPYSRETLEYALDRLAQARAAKEPKQPAMR
jgi:tetratricopeptide (TPR) repeat protein